MISTNTISTIPASDDPLSYFASTQDDLLQHEQKQPQHIECSWENDNPTYYNTAYDYDADEFQKHRMEDDIATLKLQLAEEMAEQDRLHLLARCLKKESSLLRQDLQDALGDQKADTGVQDAEGVKGTIQRYVVRVMEDKNMIQNDISMIEKEIHALKQKIQSFGVDPAYFDNEISSMDDTSVSMDDDDNSLPVIRKRHSIPEEIGRSRLTNMFSFRRYSTGNAPFFFMEGEKEKKYQGYRKTEGGEVVPESLLWD
mmetsp:Transcript_7262/g.10666  ORF Transcript_7262/g.10666 Transcript_7262/m.10666 type:complete len:256 (-) Transcript_7262:88-855(-)